MSLTNYKGGGWSLSKEIVDLATQSNYSILEIGCGAATPYLREGRDYLGLEHDPNFVQQGVQLCKLEDWYVTDLDLSKYEMVIVDGPPARTGKRKNLPLHRMNPKIWIVDDVQRRDDFDLALRIKEEKKLKNITITTAEDGKKYAVIY